MAAAEAGPDQAAAPQPIGVINVAPGVWRFAGGTMAMEFADHITLFELNGSNQRVHQVVQQAHQLVPGKRATQVIWSHHHFDHSSGLRQAVAEGLTIISRRDNGVIFSEMASRRAPNFPDDLERNFQPLKFIPVDDHLQLKDAKMTVDIYHVIANNHLADGVFAFIPEHKLYIEADVLTAAEELQWWGDSFLDNINSSQDRRPEDRAGAHGHHDLRGRHPDAASRHRAREAVLSGDAAEGELVPRLPGGREVGIRERPCIRIFCESRWGHSVRAWVGWRPSGRQASILRRRSDRHKAFPRQKPLRGRPAQPPLTTVSMSSTCRGTST